MHSKKLPLSEKVGYACGDVASNFYWRVFDVFLFIFYTDVFGLNPAIVGTMMLVTRIIDAVSDPMMGVLADRTKTRMGKFRPYLLWGIIPIFAAGVLTFTVPDLNDTGKVIWAFSTYIFMMLAYTFINVPYGALMGVMTADSKERTTLVSIRFIGAFSGGTLVAYITNDMVEWLGGGNDELGWQLLMVVYGAVAAILFAITFFASKERIQPPQIRSTPIKTDFKDLLGNTPWKVLFVLAMIIMVTISLRASSGTFYFKYYVEREDLIGDFTSLYMVSLLVGTALTPLLLKWFDKKKLLVILMIAVALLSSLFFFIPKDQIALMFVLQAAIGICLGPKSPIVFSMYADTADYSQWKTGRRATAMIFSAASFAQKLGGAVAGATIGWVLAYMGYAANVTQSSESQLGIVLLMTVIPGIFALLSVFCIRFYSLSKEQLETIHAELGLDDIDAEAGAK
ncbi:MFS transporter [Glaciecola sp. MH2013]|uniref:MFS transporter n=1 Tax=Glaciecola sp. MH2013 TaxID=2785524 RepID=UPI00189F7114|nr:MFS transporter [Glaciecola sp. MH2013]MBF7073049.1 MFS transporter [Glaciecola sp. MH2013]